jgi:hypothetical protein
MTALSLEPTQSAVVLDFINVLNDTSDYDGILKLFENKDDDVDRKRVRVCLYTYNHQWIISYAV